MSNMNQNPMEPIVAAPEMMPPAETQAPAKKNVFSIVLAVIAAVLGLAALFIPIDTYAGEMPVSCLSAANVFGYGVYLLIAGAAVSVILTVIAIISNSNCAARYAVLAAACGVAAQSVFSALVLGGKLDLIPLALTAVGAILYFIITIKQKGKNFSRSLIHLVFAWAFIALFAMAAGEAKIATNDEMLFLVAVALALIALFWSSAAIGSYKDRISSLIRGALELAAAILLFYTAFGDHPNKFMVILPAVIALIHLIAITIIIIFGTNKRVEKAKDELNKTFMIEEYAEAYPYEGGPVAGVQMAEEVNPTFRPLTPHVNTAGYDFYNSKSFDPFIATLNTDERNQFTELFILKFKGTMPELPDYEVGGDNREFFRKIFIYLGQYRDRIPSGLLGKIYQYSIKLS